MTDRRSRWNRRNRLGRWIVLAAVPIVATGCGAKNELAARDAEIASLKGRLGTAQSTSSQLESDYAGATARAQRLEAELRELSERERVAMERLEQYTVLRLPETLLFNSGSTWIKPSGKRLLGQIGDVLSRYPEHEIRITGHTDDRPIQSDVTTNWELSATRATTVVRFLVERHGVRPSRIAAIGHGEHRPVVPNDSPEGRAQNRRVEIEVAMSPPVQEIVIN